MLKNGWNYFDNLAQMFNLFERISRIPKHVGPSKGEIIQTETGPMTSVDKYAAAAIRGGHVVGHLKNKTSRKFAKTIRYYTS